MDTGVMKRNSTSAKERGMAVSPPNTPSKQPVLESEATSTINGRDATLVTSQSIGVNYVRIMGVEVIAGIAVWLGWLVLFSGGMLISSEPYRNDIANGGGFGAVALAWAMTLLFWTVTNLALLSVLSSLLGAVARRTRFIGVDSDRFNSSQRRQSLREHYMSAGMRGFGIYILVMAGMLVLATEVLSNPDAEKYMRLAATVSVIAFYGGYDPRAFKSVFNRVSSFASGNGEQDKA